MSLECRHEKNLDAGTITVETVDDKDPKASLKNAIVTTLLTPDDPRAVDLAVNFSMVANFQNKQAEKYRDVVGKYAARHKISPSLVYAVIRTESNFNPFAVSSAPAYAMMQLVPSNGGREACRAAKGRAEMPTKDSRLSVRCREPACPTRKPGNTWSGSWATASSS
jgi:soluble lytic murein transglycosylase-like protein